MIRETITIEFNLDPLWGARRRWRGTEALTPRAPQPESAEDEPVVIEPDWLRAQAPAEQRPPRPLAPSAPVEDDVPNPPPTAAMRQAAERGRWLHALFQRLPDLPAERRREGAERWLEQQGAGDAALRREVIDHTLRVIEDPHFASLFAPGALAEAPIAAVVGEAVIAGTVDRLRVEADRVQLVDFKTGRMTPRDAEEVPVAHLRQMAAYVAALEVIYPGREVRAGVLYTHAPVLFDLPRATLAAHKNALQTAQQSLLPLDIE
jgi:ATP-dependent helicase/nuclease subunit A